MSDEEQQLWHRFKFISRVAELTKDPEDVLEVINSCAKLGCGLLAKERRLLASGYQKRVLAKLEKWFIVSKIQFQGDKHFSALAKEYLKRLEDEITLICNEILLTVNDYLLPLSSTGEDGVFYYRMKGEYYSYLAEVKSDADRQEALSQSLQAYEAATAVAKSDLPPTDKLRLHLADSFSAFLYDVMDNTERARDIATKAIKDASAELHMLDIKSYKKCARCILKLKERIALWTPDHSDDEEDLQPPPRPSWFDEVDFAELCCIGGNRMALEHNENLLVSEGAKRFRPVVYPQ
ncbi:14-3-3 protein 7 [Artemisia annua]|uniref:14-3-3 protein 7 n=1 Tax=Artemisia annua TaxID=35608 RepID=A0A2U1MCK1_ARTAN|nr:14-3-3 protein 7 [Artemisia annua]